MLKNTNYTLKILIVCLIFTSLWAEDKQIDNILPFDKNTRVGKLENGITYYIRKNVMPEKRLVLRLAVNAGSVLEEDDQLGIAHYTEHMAFNGSKNFAKNDLVDYLQSVGVKFGSHLNAYTSFDETVYILPIPSDSEEIVNKGFQILEDWAHNISFEKEEIKKEVGVITEEWRMGQGAQMRIMKKILPHLFSGSRYENRLPIGKKEVFSKFDRETFLRFYRDWYRPDLMAVIAVGDIDVDVIEAKIKKHFSHIKMPENPKERKAFTIPSHKDTRVNIITDKEMPYTQVLLMHKHDATSFITEKDYRERIIHSLFSMIMNQRLRDITRQKDAPFLFANVNYTRMFGLRTKDAYQISSVTSEKNILQAIDSLVTENMRVKNFGFTKNELSIAKKNLLQQYKQMHKEMGKIPSKQFANEYVGHFLHNEPSPGIDYEYNLHLKHVPMITLEEIHGLTNKWVKDDDSVVLVIAPEKENLKLPTKVQILETIKNAKNKDLKAHEEEKIDTTLIKENLSAGKIVKEIFHEKVKATEITLSNGLRVILKTTDFKNDQIIMLASSPGGASLLSDEDYFATRGMTEILQESGLGSFTRSNLTKALAGKSVAVSPFIGELTEGFRGHATPESLDTLLKLTHLWFTKPRRDKEIFTATIAKEKTIYQNMAVDPNFYFNDQIARIVTRNHPRNRLLPAEEDWEKLDLDKMLEIYKERFANAGDFTFFFVGNFSLETIKPMLSKYLGSLPGNSEHEDFKDLGIRPPEGITKKSFYKGAAPKSSVRLYFTGDLDEYTPKIQHHLASLSQILTIRLIESLREEKGGIYSGNVRSKVSKYPYAFYRIGVSFPCAPENVDNLIASFLKLTDEMRKNGPLQKDLDKVKEGQIRELELELKRNQYWLNHLHVSDFLHLGFENPEEGKKQINNMSVKDIQNVANKYLQKNNYIQLVLYPEKQNVEKK